MFTKQIKNKKFASKDSILYFIIFLFFVIFTPAQQLPFKSYTTANGLAFNRIRQILQDKKGFLWLATNEGLSRFDGYEFVNFGVYDGLPNQIINDVLEDNEGRIWVAANDLGIAISTNQTQDETNGEAKIFKKIWVNEKVHGANKVNRILIDSTNNLWCLTDDGVFRGQVNENTTFTLIKPYKRQTPGVASRALFEANNGNIWFAIENELFEMRGEVAVNHGFINDDENNFITDAIQSKDGKILVLSNINGLFQFISESKKWQRLGDEIKEISGFSTVFEDSTNSIWIGGQGGVGKLVNGQTEIYSSPQGFGGEMATVIFEDREKNLWIGSNTSGVFKLSDMSMVSYAMPFGQISLGIAEDKGKLKSFFCDTVKRPFPNCFTQVTNVNTPKSIVTETFNKLIPRLSSINFSKRGNEFVYFAAVGEFPKITDTNFYFPDGNKIDLTEFLDKPLKTNDDLTVYFDEKGVLWISKLNGEIIQVKQKERKFEIAKFHTEENYFGVLISDGNNGVWLFPRGKNGGRLWNGSFEKFDNIEANLTGITTAFLDSRGWIWLGTYFDGLFVCKNPNAEVIEFEHFTSAKDLLSNSVWAINEDNSRKMYFGTGKGVNIFDANSNVWNSLTTKDGLIGDRISNLFKDSEGNIWMNSRNGFTKFNPNLKNKSDSAPPIYITAIKIAGENYPLSQTADGQLSTLSLDYTKNNLTFDFVGLQFNKTADLNYQFKLTGANEEWSKPSKNRTIAFANLDSGDYEFSVIAVNEDGLQSSPPAQFRFKINPPIYYRWWFIAMLILLVLVIIYAFYRVRLQKLLEVERTRALIATDLHDDIGSNLSKISVFSEVVRLQLESDGKSHSKMLSSIAEISRESVDSMSDIVWAINPKRDTILEMTRKMRQHAEESFVPKGISVNFSSPVEESKIKLSMNLRRDLFLIFKEAINNIAKHSNASQVKIAFYIRRHELIMQIEDNGIGFDLSKENVGNGLANMQKRAERLKGNLQIDSELHKGTKIIIRLPQR